MRATTAFPSVCLFISTLLFVDGDACAMDLSVAGNSQTLGVVVSNTEVKISGLTPGATVVLYSVSMEPRPYTARLVRRSEVLLDDDRDSVVTYRLTQKPSIRSIWAAVEVQNGWFAIASPSGYKPRKMYEASRLSDRTKLNTDKLQFERAAIDILLVRPGRGAWTLRSGDGWANDEDKMSNGKLIVSVEHFRPLTPEVKGTTPARVNAGDVIIAIDPYQFEYAVLQGEAKR